MLNKLQFQNLAELQLQNLDQPLCSKSEGPNVSSQICNKLLPTWSSLSTSATVTTSTIFELASSHARVTSIKFTKQESVSELVSDKGKWSDSGPIKTNQVIQGTKQHLIAHITSYISTVLQHVIVNFSTWSSFNIFYCNKCFTPSIFRACILVVAF